MNTKGFVTVHAGMFFLAGLVLGAVAMWWVINQGYIPVSTPVQ